MCAINGIAGREPAMVAQMNEKTAHRGPDDTGIFADEKVTLGHNRLSILDLSARGHQPMQNAAGTLTIVFNGEIYNFKELRSALQAKGAVFASDTDTEVILEGYGREGAAFFNKMRGMWALALYDALQGYIILARDPFGIKPLYYYDHGGHFAFSSELRGLGPALKRFGHTDDALAHRLYFVLGYIPAPYSPFAEVGKVLPGAVLSYDCAKKKLASLDTIKPYTDEHKTLEEALDSSIRAHFVSDVPVGLFFSGGIDSTLLLAKALELGFSPQAFFLDIPDRLDRDYALAAAKALGVTLTTFGFTPTDAVESLLSAHATLDEPFADSSYLPTEYLSRLVAQTHKVVLSGEGGDEFFGGYHRHNHLLRLRRGLRLFPETLVSRFPMRARRGIEAKLNRDPYATYIEFTRLDEGLAARGEALAFVRERIARGSFDELPLAFDETLYLPDDLLFKIDRAAMRYGLEGRVPLLDRVFFAAARRFSTGERQGTSKTGKEMLKNILRRSVPEELVERPKQGFSTPLRVLHEVPRELFNAARAEALRHRELVPYNPAQALAYPQTAYALLMWAGWRESFFASL